MIIPRFINPQSLKGGEFKLALNLKAQQFFNLPFLTNDTWICLSGEHYIPVSTVWRYFNIRDRDKSNIKKKHLSMDNANIAKVDESFRPDQVTF